MCTLQHLWTNQISSDKREMRAPCHPKQKADKSPKSGNQKNQSKPKRSFLPRLPSFRKKKSGSPVSQADKTPSPNLTSKEEPIIGKTKEVNYVMRRSKTSELVASFEKRLSDLKEDDPKIIIPKPKLDNSKADDNATITAKSPTSGTSKFSRFGFKGIAAHRISRFENRNNNGNGEKVEEKTEEINANSPTSKLRKPATLSNRNLSDNRRTQTDVIRSGSTSSAKSPDSECSSPGSLSTSTKVLGLPMPYRSVFSDEPRGLKRQASSQSVDPISSGISTASTSSTPSPCIETMLAAEREEVSHRAMLNATFSLSEPKGLNISYCKEPLDPFNTTKDEEASGTRFSKGVLTYRTKEIKQALITSSAPTSPASQQEDVLNPVKETLISHSESMPHSTTAPAAETLGALPVTRPDAGSQGVSCLGQDNTTVECQPLSTHRQEGDSETPNKSQCDHDIVLAATTGSEQINTDTSESLSAVKADSVETMGSTQSALDPTAISTPARPLHLSLKPHLSAIKYASESFDSVEQDSISLGSDDLMCDSRFLEDETFNQTGEESRLSRSCGMEVTPHRYPNGYNGNRTRTSSLDQVAGPVTIDKRPKLNRGISTPSPLGVTPTSKRRGWNRPASRSVSAMEELGHLISSTVLSDSRHQFGAHNTNRNRSNSSLTSTTHPLRPPRWLSHQEDEEDIVLVDAVVYRHMLQDITYLKTMLLRLKRALQQTETSSPFEHPLRSPFNSVPSSPMSDAYLLPDSTVADLAEENQVLRTEVKKLQELLVDKECDLNTLSKQLVKPDNKNTGTQCEDVQPVSASVPSSSSSPSIPLLRLHARINAFKWICL
ncbi:uncharacterized protein [Amphiura filiformis]|uniref:uncharacterized protein isoform X1 n=1 Tax=Amphiura filiformis TaxID=82378 RepID=UPI003B227148